MKKGLILIFFLLVAQYVFGQDYYKWQLTSEDGLPSMEVYYMYQDSKGYIWIGTNEGLCRYDGFSVKKYKHPLQKGNAVAKILEDKYGRIWYKQFSGQLFFIDTSNNINLFELPDFLNIHTYYHYTIIDNELTVVTNGIYTYNFDTEKWTTDSIPHISSHRGSRLVSHLEKREDNSLLFVSDIYHQLWVRNKKENIYKGDVNDFYIPIAIGLDSVMLFRQGFHNDFYIDHIDSIPLKKEVARVSFDTQEKERRILGVVNQNDETLWMKTTKGLYGFERNAQNKWKQSYHLLKDKQVSAILRDREGNLWISTLLNGIYIIPSLEMEYYTADNSSLISGNITCIEKKSADELLLGSSNGIVTNLDVAAKKIKGKYIGKYGNVISMAFDAKRDELYFDTYGLQMAKLDDSKLKTKYYGKKSGGGHHLYIWNEDILLQGRTENLVAINIEGGLGKNRLDTTVFGGSSLIGNDFRISIFPKLKKVRALCLDKVNKNQFWVGGNDSLYCYTQNKRVAILDNNAKSIIPSDITQDANGIVWVSTLNRGIYRIENQKVTANYTQKDGLPSNNCKKIKIHKHQVWVVTNKGLTKLNSLTNGIDNYSQLDGLVSEEIKDIEIIGEKIWATTPKGLISFSVDITAINTKSPFIELVSVFINNKLYTNTSGADLLYTQNDLKFNFQTTALRGRKSIKYQYRLLGVDTTWVELPYSTNFVQFQGLISGDFIFEVRAINEDNIVSSEAARFAFSITPPYWQRWWFYLMIVVSIFFFIGGIAYWRYKIYQKEQNLSAAVSRLKMQSLQSQMNPHFVFNAMSAIQSYWVQKESKKALIYHAKFARLMRLIFIYSNDLTIGIEEEEEFLKLYISLEEVRYEDEAEVELNIDEQLIEEELSLPPLLIQPLIENAFKHGLLHKKTKGKILISIQKEENYIYGLIKDNGVGRAQAEAYASWRESFDKKLSSLDIIQERLAILNESYGVDKQKKVFEITDLLDSNGVGNGTLIEFWLPIFSTN